MYFLQTEEEFFKILAIYLYQNFYYPSGTVPLPATTIFTLIVVLIGLISASVPLIYYATKLQGFVKYSKMWAPWKKLALGWLLIILGGVAGIAILSSIYLLGFVNQPFVTVTFLFLILSPLIIFVLISITLTLIGIRQFYQNAKKAVEAASP